MGSGMTVDMPYERYQEIAHERNELLKAIQAEHRAKAAIGGSPCVCKWCKRS